MSRSARFLEWANPDQKEFTQRCEVALVREAKGASGEKISDVVNDRLGESYDSHFINSNIQSDRWLDAKLRSNNFPIFTSVNLNTEGHELSHYIFFATNFGKLSIPTSLAIQTRLKILDLIKGLTTADANYELLAQYLLALECLKVPIPPSNLNQLRSYFDRPWDEWNIKNYHSNCVAAILFAMRGD